MWVEAPRSGISQKLNNLHSYTTDPMMKTGFNLTLTLSLKRRGEHPTKIGLNYDLTSDSSPIGRGEPVQSHLSGVQVAHPNLFGGVI